ncbi:MULTISPECIES: hypothetical protein [Mycobacteriaceae]|uniref:hypothetical protein n=1 Tax=Mycobacteriaceae TaxID=1762 RepID=UPI00351BA559
MSTLVDAEVRSKEETVMQDSTEQVFDARDTEAIKLLKTDPDKYFAETKRRLPFGFSSRDDNDEK